LTGPQSDPIHRAQHCSGNNQVVSAAVFGISPMPEPIDATGVSYRGTAHADKMQVLDSTISPQAPKRRDRQMTLTVAHISPIMSLIAGVLILIMPRLLNLVVAIYLILNGLIGLGLLKWLHI
jgi:hypothetical protein